jgi:uncharacterized membrane protein YedE/YeeE
MYDPKSHAASPTASKYAAWAIVVMVLGWLLAIGTGLCGSTFVISGIADGGAGYGSAMIMAGLILGGVPCLVGIGMILAARKWGKRKPPSSNPDVFT